mmetsp:Transcript_31671/g.49579  ORF Transcript_31671/g.49579 Transcript_31671/m.49579 type:complete len:169 (+) Transcript_31671:271-777(+)
MLFAEPYLRRSGQHDGRTRQKLEIAARSSWLLDQIFLHGACLRLFWVPLPSSSHEACRLCFSLGIKACVLTSHSPFGCKHRATRTSRSQTNSDPVGPLDGSFRSLLTVLIITIKDCGVSRGLEPCMFREADGSNPEISTTLATVCRPFLCIPFSFGTDDLCVEFVSLT